MLSLVLALFVVSTLVANGVLFALWRMRGWYASQQAYLARLDALALERRRAVHEALAGRPFGLVSKEADNLAGRMVKNRLRNCLVIYPARCLLKESCFHSAE